MIGRVLLVVLGVFILVVVAALAFYYAAPKAQPNPALPTAAVPEKVAQPK